MPDSREPPRPRIRTIYHAPLIAPVAGILLAGFFAILIWYRTTDPVLGANVHYDVQPWRR